MNAETEKYRQRLQKRQDMQTHLRSGPPSPPPPEPFTPSPPDTDGKFIKSHQKPRPLSPAQLAEESEKIFGNPTAQKRMAHAQEIARIIEMKPEEIGDLEETEALRHLVAGLRSTDGRMAIESANALIDKFKNSPLAMLRVIK